MISLPTVILVLIIQITFFGAVHWAVTRAAIAEIRKDREREDAQVHKSFVEITEKVRQSNSNLWYMFCMVCFDPDPKRNEEKRIEVLNALTRWLS